MQRFRKIISVMYVVFILLGLTAPGWASSRSYAAPPAAPLRQGGITTPFLNALSASLGQRQAAGLSVPRVSTSQQITGSVALTMGSSIRPFTVVTTTVIHFSGPEEAGYETWPRWIVDEGMAPGGHGTVAVGDYTDRYRAAVAAAVPGYWDRVEFGHEPRVHTVTETIRFSAPDSFPQAATGHTSTTEDVLMGFTYTGLNLWYGIEDSVCTDILGDTFCGNFKAGFNLEWALGLRLPAEVSLSGPATVAAGDAYRPSAVLTPLDWEADDYAQAGVDEHDGNEYVLKFIFFIGAEGTLTEELTGATIDLCPDCNFQVDIDNSYSFTTPLGPGQAFPLGSITQEIYALELQLPDPLVASLSFSLGITPQLGSSRISADWRVLNGGTGNGSVEFTSAGTPVELGYVVVDAPGSSSAVDVELSNFRYWFNQFLIEIFAEISFSLPGIEWPPLDIPITTFDLTPLTPDNLLYLGAHTQCTWNFICDPAGPDNRLVLSSGMEGGGGSASVSEPPPPSVPLCADLDGTTSETIRANVPPETVTDGSVFCRSLVEDSVFVQDAAEIGKPEVLEREIIQAVDVFALFHDGSPTALFNRAPTVCLRGSGALLYLDATVAPRTVAELPVFTQSGYTCGSIPNAGTLVLVSGAPGVIDPALASATGTITPLSDCMVTTLDMVNLRDQPGVGSAVVRMIPYNVTLTAFERSGDWFYVDYVGSRGWVNARFVSPQGTCR